MRNRYTGTPLNGQAQTGVEVLGLELKDLEYGSLWGIGLLFIISITGGLRRALNMRP